MSNVSIAGEINKILPSHHVQQELCTTRPLYRQGRKLTAVKVYTINDESQHLIIYRVPKINLCNELKALCMRYGELKILNILTNHQTEVFTECYHAHFVRIQSARIAKRFLDNKEFYGETLHVCYAPEFETLNETKNKLKQREHDVSSRLEPGPTLLEYANVQIENVQENRKRKNPAIPITDKRLSHENTGNIWDGIPSEIDPRLQASFSNQIGFKKHFQIIHKKQKGLEYGPYMPTDPILQAFNKSNVKVETQPRIQTTLLPTTVIKNYDKSNNKRIVFRKSK